MAFLPLGHAIVGFLATWLGAELVLSLGAVLQLTSVPVLVAMSCIREFRREDGRNGAVAHESRGLAVEEAR